MILTACARDLDFVREVGGPNKGRYVSFIQRYSGGKPGDSWCAFYLSMVLDVAYLGAPPLKRTGACQVMLSEAIQKSFLVRGEATLDDLFFYLNAEGLAHHCGIVTGIDDGGRLIGIAGNTSPDGSSDNGTGVFEHGLAKTRIVLIRLPEPPRL